MINKSRIDKLGIKPESIRKFITQIEEQEINIKDLRKWQRGNSRLAKEKMPGFG